MSGFLGYVVVILVGEFRGTYSRYDSHSAVSSQCMIGIAVNYKSTDTQLYMKLNQLFRTASKSEVDFDTVRANEAKKIIIYQRSGVLDERTFYERHCWRRYLYWDTTTAWT